MSLRIIKIVTSLRPGEAYTLVEFLDQLRDVLIQTYGDEIRTMLQDATTPFEPKRAKADDDEPF